LGGFVAFVALVAFVARSVPAKGAGCVWRARNATNSPSGGDLSGGTAAAAEAVAALHVAHMARDAFSQPGHSPARLRIHAPKFFSFNALDAILCACGMTPWSIK
jgi:hypothetical protein